MPAHSPYPLTPTPRHIKYHHQTIPSQHPNPHPVVTRGPPQQPPPAPSPFATQISLGICVIGYFVTPPPRYTPPVHTLRTITFLLTSVLALIPLAHLHAHDSPATQIYLKYQINPGEPELIMVLEGAANHFEPLRSIPKLTPPDDSTPFHQPYLDLIARLCPVEADGKTITPTLRNLEFAPIPDEQVLPDRPVDILLALSVLVYPLEKIPSEITINWNLYPVLPGGFAPADFSETGHLNLDEVIMTYQIGTAGTPDFFPFSPANPSFTWDPSKPNTSPAFMDDDPASRVAELQIAHYIVARSIPVSAITLTLAVLSLVTLLRWLPGRPAWKYRWRIAFALAFTAYFTRHQTVVAEIPYPSTPPAETLTQPEIETLFTALHRNIYAAFDYPDEDEAYNVLSQSVAGPLLDRLYTEVYQSLVLEEADGAIATVQRVDISGLTTTPSDDQRAIDITAGWTVNGVVSHLGHVHLRTNRYTASYRMEPVDGLWKITAADQLLAERLSAEEKPNTPSDDLFPQ